VYAGDGPRNGAGDGKKERPSELSPGTMRKILSTLCRHTLLARAPLFDHLVGALLKQRRHVKAERGAYSREMVGWLTP
jgi:hypothetical protein